MRFEVAYISPDGQVENTFKTDFATRDEATKMLNNLMVVMRGVRRDRFFVREVF